MDYVWILSFKENLTSQQEQVVHNILVKFTQNWTSHDNPVDSSWDIKYHRFLIITGSTKEEVTGCTHDRVTRLIKRFEKQEIFMAPRSAVFYKDEHNEVHSLSRQTFKEQYANATIHDQTIVFDTTLIKPQDLEQFEVQLKDSWHSKLVS